MSSKITVSEILSALADLPPGPDYGADALSAAMAAMEARSSKAIHTRVILYRFDNGPTAQADQYQAAMQAGTLPVIEVARELDCDLQLIEIGSGETDAEDNARACAFGMMAAEEDTGLIAVCAFGAGSEERAGKIDPKNFFETATPEVAAQLGAMIAGARAGIPVIAEGIQGLRAAQALQVLRPDLTGKVFVCGVDQGADRIHVFADAEKSEVAYTAVMLAAVLQSEFAERKAA